MNTISTRLTPGTIPEDHASGYGVRRGASAPREFAFLLDGSSRIVSWSLPGWPAVGFTLNEVLGKHCWEVLQGSDTFVRPLPCDRCRRSANSGRPWRTQTALILKGRDGKRQRLVHQLLPLSEGPEGKSLVIFREPSQRMAAQAGPSPGQSLPGRHLSAYGDPVRHLAALENVSARLNTSDMAVAVDGALDEVLRGTGAEVAELFLFNRAGSEMVLAAHTGLFRKAFYQISRFQLGEGFPGLVASRGEPLVTSELPSDLRFLRTKVKQKGFQVYLCVPLKTPGGTIGSLNIASRRSDLDVTSQLRFLTLASTPLSLAIESARLRLEQAACREDEESFDSSDSPDLLLGRRLRTISEAHQAVGGKLMLLDGRGHMAASYSHPGPDHWGCSGAGSAADGCPALRARRPHISTRDGVPSDDACRGILAESRSAVCLPLESGERTVGLITLLYNESYQASLRRLSLLGGTGSAVAREVWRGYRDLMASRRSAHFISQGPTAVTDLTEATPYLDIYCLGGFRVYKEGKPLTPAEFGRRSAVSVLKVLVANRGKPVSQDMLIECIWPEADPKRARANLWVAVHSLRKAVERGPESPHVILTDGETYRFNTDISHRIDLDTVLGGLSLGEERESEGDPEGALSIYRAAVRSYGGDLFEDGTYCDWCVAQRDYFLEVYLSLLMRMACLHEAGGAYEQAVLCCRQALAKDSLREEVHRHLMCCLWRAGRKDEALHQYHECKQLLARELDVEPMEETRALYGRIRSG